MDDASPTSTLVTLARLSDDCYRRRSWLLALVYLLSYGLWTVLAVYAYEDQ